MVHTIHLLVYSMFRALLLLLVALVFAVNGKDAIPTVSQLDIQSYLGHWTLVYQSPTNWIFQGYGKCITADYGLLDNGNISVLNTQLNLKNETEQISGYGYCADISEPGKLTVHLDGTPEDAPYWVVQLGEVKNDQYQYTIVTSPSGISLWVLVRDIASFFDLYDVEVVDFLHKYGFVYRPVSQTNCDDH